MLLPLVLVASTVLIVSGLTYERLSARRDAAMPLPGRLVEVLGTRLHATDDGAGAPTVVVICGAGDSSYSWLHVKREVSRFTRIVSYDRPGLGGSDPGPAPDPVRSVDEFAAVLAALDAPGPYVLVGHSLGGLIARLFALRHPERVCGLVFVDSTHEHLRDDRKFRQGMTAIGVLLRIMRLTSAFGLPRFLGQAFEVMPMYPERPHYAGQLTPAEYAQWSASVYRNGASLAGPAELRAAFRLIEAAEAQRQALVSGPQFGDLPLVVLSNPSFGEAWTAMQRELSTRSSQGVHRVSDRPGHCIQMPRPQLVIGAIREVVDEARRRIAAA